MYIPILLGTAREGRLSEKAALFVEEEAKKFGFETEIIDPRTVLKAPATSGEIDESYREKIQRADGILIVSPEYNHGYPGELKIMLDSAYKEYFGKPVGICGVSTGLLGGVRMTEQLRLVLIEFHMINTREAVYFNGAEAVFSEVSGTKENFVPYLKKLFEEIKEKAFRK